MQAYTVNTWLPAPTGKPPEANEVQRRLWTAVQRRDLPGQTTYDQYALAGQYDGAVYIALQAISSAMSGATMQVLKRKQGSKSLAYNANDANSNKDWVPAGDECGACRLLAYINPQQTPINFLVEYITCLLLFGRVFVYAVPSRSGKPCELWVIRPQYVMPIYAVSADYPFGAWRVTIPQPFMYGFAASGTVIIDARDMVEERMFNPQFPWDGYSPLTAGAQQIDTLRSVNESRKNTLDRGPSVDAVVTIDGASETELSRIKAEYENKYTGSRGSRVMFSSGESAKAAALGIAPKEMDFSSGYDQLTNFVLGLLGVPHPVAQLTDTSSYAQLYASIQQFRELKLKPLANSIAAHWTKHLIQKHWGHEYAMTFEMPKLTNPESEDAAIQALGGMGVYTVNEIRAKRNEEPIEGGDVPPSVYVQTLQAKQQAAMQPQPGMEGDVSGVINDTSNGESGLNNDNSQPGGELGDILMNGVMDSLGDGKVMKAMFEESKHPRDHGKFASKPGGSNYGDHVDIGNETGKPIEDTAHRFNRTGLKPAGDVFWSRERDYAEEFGKEVSNGMGTIETTRLSLKNPLHVLAKPHQFSDPSFENPIIRQAKEDGHDGVIFDNPKYGDRFYVVFGERVAKAMGWTAVQTRTGKTAAKNSSTGVIVYGKRAEELLGADGPKQYPQVDLKPPGKKLSQEDADGIDLGGDYGTAGDVMRDKPTAAKQQGPHNEKPAPGEKNPLHDILAKEPKGGAKDQTDFAGGFGSAKGSTLGTGAAGLVRAVADSLSKTGELPPQEKNTVFGKAWEMVKAKHGNNPLSRAKFGKAFYDSVKNGGDGIDSKGMLTALNRHFSESSKSGSGATESQQPNKSPDGKTYHGTGGTKPGEFQRDAKNGGWIDTDGNRWGSDTPKPNGNQNQYIDDSTEEDQKPIPVAERLGNNGMRIAKVAKLKIAKVAKQVQSNVEQHLQTPEGKEQAKTIDKWAPILAKKHAAVVAAKTGMADAEAHDLLLMLIQTVVSHLPIIGKLGGSVVGILRHQNTKKANSEMRGAIDDHTASVASQRAGLDPEDDASTLPRNKNGTVRLGRNRIAGVLSPPKNKAGKGSLPPRAMLRKSLRYIDRILEAEVRS